MKIIMPLCALLLIAGCATRTHQAHYDGVTTPALQLRRSQCLEYLNSPYELAMSQTYPVPFVMGRRDHRRQEAENIENELVRRWQAGDAAAYLPAFGPQSTAHK